jgi:hypothetical protein
VPVWRPTGTGTRHTTPPPVNTTALYVKCIRTHFLLGNLWTCMDDDRIAAEY